MMLLGWHLNRSIQAWLLTGGFVTAGGVPHGCSAALSSKQMDLDFFSFPLSLPSSMNFPFFLPGCLITASESSVSTHPIFMIWVE